MAQGGVQKRPGTRSGEYVWTGVHVVVLFGEMENRLDM